MHEYRKFFLAYEEVLKRKTLNYKLKNGAKFTLKIRNDSVEIAEAVAPKTKDFEPIRGSGVLKAALKEALSLAKKHAKNYLFFDFINEKAVAGISKHLRPGSKFKLQRNKKYKIPLHEFKIES